MLDRIGLNNHSDRIRNAVFSVFEEGKWITRDVGGKGSTSDFVKAIIDRL